MEVNKNSNKPVILIFLNHYLPGFKAGGPMRSVSNIVSWLGDNFHFKIITTDRDAGDQQPYSDIKINDWNKVGNAEVYYTAEKDIGVKRFYALLKHTSYDAVYLNSFWNSRFSILPFILLKYMLRFDMNKVLIAPRGEFSVGALSIKTFKKTVFLRLAKIFRIYSNNYWQATNEQEKKEIGEVLSIENEMVLVASNLPKKVTEDLEIDFFKESGKLKAVYLSRITPKKNLKMAINVLSKVKNARVIFDIYGNISDEDYWEACKKLINTLPDNIEVTYKGVIANKNVPEMLKSYHLFFMPTKGENFGHAIFESMMAGTPVLISDQTPWTDLEKKQLGWAIPLAQDDNFQEVIEYVASLDEEELRKVKKGVREKILELDIEKVAGSTNKMLNKVAS